MIILIGYELDDEIYNNCFSGDIHPDDACELVIDHALEQDYRHHVWHLPDSAELDMHKALEGVFNKHNSNVALSK